MIDRTDLIKWLGRIDKRLNKKIVVAAVEVRL